MQTQHIVVDDFWGGEFGDAYTARNRVDWIARIPFWRQILDITRARSVMEFGCNAGWNLSAIHRIQPDVQVSGFEINSTALMQARKAGVDCNKFGSTNNELAFTAGVLIHIPPAELRQFMQNVIDASCDWVLAVEYAAETEEEVLYRGHAGKLWRRPYGRLYQDMGLKLVQSGEVGKEHGFDSCCYWLLRK